jgi:predicted membrane protein (TIGR00267 family)
MRVLTVLSEPENRLDVVAGLCDGILSALILTAGRLLDGGESVTLGLALRVATAGTLTGAFAFFVAHYADLRSELIRAERQLNLVSHGRFASGRLGRAALRDSCTAALIVGICGFLGALLPLGVSAALPELPWLGLATALSALGLLGVLLARTVYGNPLRWALVLVVAGVLVSATGVRLKIT